MLEGLRSSNITIVEPGRVPSKPAKPNVKLYLLAAIAGGLILGLASAFCLEAMDSKVRDLQVLSGRFGDALFGELPYERMRSGPGRNGDDASRARFVYSCRSVLSVQRGAAWVAHSHSARPRRVAAQGDPGDEFDLQARARARLLLTLETCLRSRASACF